MKYIVYKYTSPTKKSYIGYTDNEERRKGEHFKKELNFTDNTSFARAIRKYGFETLEYEVLYRFEDKQEALLKEIEMIKFYDSIESGYNIHTGGTSGRGPIHDDRVVEDVVYLLKNRQDLTLQQISDITGVSTALICDIKNGNKRNMEKIERRSYQNQIGEDNKAAKLTEELVKEIKNKLTAGTSRKEIQVEYNVSKTLIQQLATGQIWGHVESDYEYKKLVVNGNAKLTAETVKEIKRDQEGGMSLRETVEKYNISRSTVQQIRYGKTWKDV